MAEQIKRAGSKQTSMLILIIIALSSLLACGPSETELKKRERREMILKKASSLYQQDRTAPTVLKEGIGAGPSFPNVLKRPYPQQADVENLVGRSDYREVIKGDYGEREVMRLYWWEEDKSSDALTGQHGQDTRHGLRLILTADFSNEPGPWTHSGMNNEPGALYEIHIHDFSITEDIDRDAGGWRWRRELVKKP